MTKLADYVTTLTPEEREQFKELIAECESREADIHANDDATTQAIHTLAETNEKVMIALRQLEERVANLYLRVVPPKGRMN